MKRETIDKKLEALKRKEEKFQEKVNAFPVFPNHLTKLHEATSA